MRTIDKKLVRNVLCTIEIDGKKHEIKSPTLKQILERLKKVQEFTDYSEEIRQRIEEGDQTALLEFKTKEAEFRIEDTISLSGLSREIVEGMTEEMMIDLNETILNGEESKEDKKKTKKKGSRGGK
ncbi:MAG: hypothetical protein ACFFD1_02015 [Candidatus Thorarchaeota archaeon]